MAIVFTLLFEIIRLNLLESQKFYQRHFRFISCSLQSIYQINIF